LKKLISIGALLFCMYSYGQTADSGKGKRLIFEEVFSTKSLSDQWIVEHNESRRDPCTIINGQLELNTEGGITLWYKNRLNGNIMIEYDREVIMDSGRNDRLSDLNQFWMATDLQGKMFNRKGGFREYDSLQMYYVGMGGNYNTTTRMRKYNGKGELKILGEFTDTSHLLRANHKYHIVIIVKDGLNSFIIDGVEFFSFQDESPLTAGWFAIRSTKSRQRIDNIKIWQLD
jgi:Domain of unknown function (DUF6250)